MWHARCSRNKTNNSRLRAALFVSHQSSVISRPTTAIGGNEMELDMKLVAHAKDYLDALGKGIDPLSGALISEGEVIRQERLVKCFHFVSNVLQSILENNLQHQKPPAKNAKDKEPFDLKTIDLSLYPNDEEPIGISRLIGRINDLRPDNMEKLKRTGILNWLEENRYLQNVEINGKNSMRPGPRAAEIGIFQAQQTNADGRNYTAVLYSSSAQQFILSNLAHILSVKGNPSSRKHPNKGNPWTEEDNTQLNNLLEKGTAISEIAIKLGRTQHAIEMRIEKLQNDALSKERFQEIDWSQTNKLGDLLRKEKQ